MIALSTAPAAEPELADLAGKILTFAAA